MSFALPSRLFPIALVAALGLMLAACTTNPYTGEQQISRTAGGAGVGATAGALGGAIIGAATGGSAGAGRGALIGAGVGALAGGGIGAYMDRQEAILRSRLEATGVSVTRFGNEIVLNMPSNITFDTDRAEVKAQFYDVLTSVALVLNEFDQTLVNVNGHTDSDGSEAYNFQLSQQRAQSVADFLSTQNVDPRRLVVRGFGESQPIASNQTDTGKAQNRRVEIRITPIQA